MKAICKKEFRGFFTSMTGYVFLALILLLTGVYFTAYHLQAAYPKFAYTLRAMLFILLLAVPVLTMRSLAEEKHQKTDQLLLTAPVSVTEIVLGKFLALLGVLGVAAAILAVYPLILLQFGDISLKESYNALLGFFLMGAAYLAIGLFISSLTESQVIAAVVTFVVLFVCYVSSGIANFFPDTAGGSYFALAVLAAILCLLVYRLTAQVLPALILALIPEGALLAVYLLSPSFYEGLIRELFTVINLNAHYENFVDGILDLTAVIYYLSVTAVCLFLTVQTIQKRRWS